MEKQIYTATLLAKILDNQFSIFGFRFGVSAIIDLIPGLGDMLDLFLSLYIIYLAIQLQIPFIGIAEMVWNILLSFALGILPIVGDIGYIFYKPNLRNIAILKRYIPHTL